MFALVKSQRRVENNNVAFWGERERDVCSIGEVLNVCLDCEKDLKKIQKRETLLGGEGVSEREREEE